MRRLLALVVLVLVGCTPAAQHAATPTPTHPSGVCAAGPAYPDPACTPGATDPKVTQATIRSTICVPGWTATVRKTSQAVKDQVLAEYGLTKPFAGEIDHFISLELGGADTLPNLWPEAGPIPNPKDAVENRLHKAVCAGTLTLAQARAEITRWTEHR